MAGGGGTYFKVPLTVVLSVMLQVFIFVLRLKKEINFLCLQDFSSAVLLAATGKNWHITVLPVSTY